MPLGPGLKLGKYDVIEMIGSGGMGRVYRARDPMLGRQVAVKVLREELASDPERLRRFEQEARAASALNHPNIVHVYEIGDHEGVRYIAMEYVEGKTLRPALTGGPLPTKKLLNIAAQTADGLAKAHAGGIVHRDLKPENIVISEEGHVKILDFGLAKLRPEPSQVDSDVATLDRLETREGVIVGTTSYMSPEQMKGLEVDFRSDQFAFGAVLYEMATGKRPFEKPSPAETISATLNEDPVPVTVHNPAVPAELARIIVRCLSKDPQDRYDSTRDLARDIHEVQLPPPRAPVLAPPPTAGPIRRLAVLPMENVSGDPEQEYFADGMTEALIADLAKIHSLRVISRTSSMRYKRSGKPLPQIARELGVDAVLEGSVLSSEGKVRITTQLIRGDTDEHLWAESYERRLEGVLDLQRLLARAIAEEIQVTLSPEDTARLTAPASIHPEAYQLYLKGNFQLGKGTESSFRHAVEHYRQAITIDTTFAPAYAGLAVAYIDLGSWASSLPPAAVHAEARSAALEALERDSTLAEAHIALARIKHLFEWDWAGAEASFRRGIELNPSSTHALIIYENYLISMGRFEESVTIGTRTLERDPLSTGTYLHVGWALEYLGRDTEAMEQYQKGLELAPEDFGLNLVLAEFCVHRGRLDEASRLTERAENLLGAGGSPTWLALLGYIYARANRRIDAVRILNELETRAKGGYVPPNARAGVHIGLDQREKALELLEQAYAKRDVTMVWLKVRRVYDSLRNEPRFQDLLRRMNFPA
jgi:serine/threonine protein kinase/tetratricopeptide (TPR) repeat protein